MAQITLTITVTQDDQRGIEWAKEQANLVREQQELEPYPPTTEGSKAFLQDTIEASFPGWNTAQAEGSISNSDFKARYVISSDEQRLAAYNQLEPVPE